MLKIYLQPNSYLLMTVSINFDFFEICNTSNKAFHMGFNNISKAILISTQHTLLK